MVLPRVYAFAADRGAAIVAFEATSALAFARPIGEEGRTTVLALTLGLAGFAMVAFEWNSRTIAAAVASEPCWRTAMFAPIVKLSASEKIFAEFAGVSRLTAIARAHVDCLHRCHAAILAPFVWLRFANRRYWCARPPLLTDAACPATVAVAVIANGDAIICICVIR